MKKQYTLITLVALGGFTYTPHIKPLDEQTIIAALSALCIGSLGGYLWGSYDAKYSEQAKINAVKNFNLNELSSLCKHGLNSAALAKIIGEKNMDAHQAKALCNLIKQKHAELNSATNALHTAMAGWANNPEKEALQNEAKKSLENCEENKILIQQLYSIAHSSESALCLHAQSKQIEQRLATGYYDQIPTGHYPAIQQCEKLECDYQKLHQATCNYSATAQQAQGFENIGSEARHILSKLQAKKDALRCSPAYNNELTHKDQAEYNKQIIELELKKVAIQQNNYEHRIQELLSKNQELKFDKKDALEKLREYQSENAALKLAIKKLKFEIEKLEQQLKNLADDSLIEQLKARIRQLEDQVEKLEKALELTAPKIAPEVAYGATRTR